MGEGEGLFLILALALWIVVKPDASAQSSRAPQPDVSWGREKGEESPTKMHEGKVP